MSAGMRAAASLQLDHGVRTGIGQLIEKCKQLAGLKTAKWGFPIARICHLAYIAIRRREGTDPWAVGTTSARPSRPPREIPDGPFLCYDTCRALILQVRPPWCPAVCAWRAHIVLAERRLAEHRTSLQPPSLVRSSFCRLPVRCVSRKNFQPIPTHSRLDRAAIAGRPALRDQTAVRSRR